MTTNKQTRSETWISLIIEAIQDTSNGSYQARTNDETANRLGNYLRILMRGEALSKDQSKNLFQTLTKRTKRSRPIRWDQEPIKLTTRQLDTAKADPIVKEFMELDRRRLFAENIIMDEVRRKLDEFDFRDVEQLNQFAEAIRNCQPAPVEIEEVALVVEEPAAPPPTNIADIMALFPTKSKFPSEADPLAVLEDQEHPLAKFMLNRLG